MARLLRLLATPALALALLPLACTAADQPKYELGKQYTALRSPQPTSDPSKIEVIEVFAYSCPHCYAFDPYVRDWLKKKPADVNFVRLPHTLGQSANILRNKAFYTAQMLGVFEPFHVALFDAIHKEGQMVSSPEQLRDLMVQKTGIKPEDFDGAFNSFAVDANYRRGENEIKDMGIASVPTVIVEGKYMVTPRLEGGFPEMLKVIDFLVDQARKDHNKDHKKH